MYHPITFVPTSCQDWLNRTALSFTKGMEGLHGCIIEVFTKSGSVQEPGREKKGFSSGFGFASSGRVLVGSLWTNWGSTWEQPQPLSLLSFPPNQPIHTNHTELSGGGQGSILGAQPKWHICHSLIISTQGLILTMAILIGIEVVTFLEGWINGKTDFGGLDVQGCRVGHWGFWCWGLNPQRLLLDV